MSYTGSVPFLTACSPPVLQSVSQAGCRAAPEIQMLHYAVVFFIVALIAALLGFTGIAASAAGIAKILFVVFLVMALLAFVFGKRRV
jgi:uncharacterized membrane protein YtjA (UPF0391 family)